MKKYHYLIEDEPSLRCACGTITKLLELVNKRAYGSLLFYYFFGHDVSKVTCLSCQKTESFRIGMAKSIAKRML